MRKPLLTTIIILTACLSAYAEGQAARVSGAFTKLEARRLPDLNTARSNHLTLVTGGELTVIGGHTDGFNLAETAEYFRGGRWIEVPMHYPHDGCFRADLPDGRIMVGGGSAEPFGIGQSWGVETYDPAAHSFFPIGILDRKRAYSSACVLPDGRVVVSGNWYADDATEVWSAENGFEYAAPAVTQHSRPWILPYGDSDALIFGSADTRGMCLDETTVETLSGAVKRTEPLLEQWLLPDGITISAEDSRISEGTYLMAARNRADNATPGVVKVADGVFSLLALDSPIPSEGIAGAKIIWALALQVDRPSRTAWMQGNDARGRIYFARIDYDASFDGGKAGVSLFYAENPDGPLPYNRAVLVGDGELILAGGQTKTDDTEHIILTNFKNSAEVWEFSLEQKGGIPLWVWIVAAFILICAARAVYIAISRGAKAQSSKQEKINRSLLEQMSTLIEEKELWKRKDLRLSDIATELASNRTYVSTIINNINGTKFTTLINGYRIRYAQQLMREHPEMVLDDVADAAGFSSRTTFYRAFKAHTGKTPKQWIEEEG